MCRSKLEKAMLSNGFFAFGVQGCQPVERNLLRCAKLEKAMLSNGFLRLRFRTVNWQSATLMG